MTARRPARDTRDLRYGGATLLHGFTDPAFETVREVFVALQRDVAIAFVPNLRWDWLAGIAALTNLVSAVYDCL